MAELGLVLRELLLVGSDGAEVLRQTLLALWLRLLPSRFPLGLGRPLRIRLRFVVRVFELFRVDLRVVVGRGGGTLLLKQEEDVK